MYFIIKICYLLDKLPIHSKIIVNQKIKVNKAALSDYLFKRSPTAPPGCITANFSISYPVSSIKAV